MACYSEAVRLSAEALPMTLRARFAFLTQQMLEHGPDLGAPPIKALEDGLLKMCFKGAEGIARVLYCVMHCVMAGLRIMGLHNFN